MTFGVLTSRDGGNPTGKSVHKCLNGVSCERCIRDRARAFSGITRMRIV